MRDLWWTKWPSRFFRVLMSAIPQAVLQSLCLPFHKQSCSPYTCHSTNSPAVLIPAIPQTVLQSLCLLFHKQSCSPYSCHSTNSPAVLIPAIPQTVLQSLCLPFHKQSCSPYSCHSTNSPAVLIPAIAQTVLQSLYLTFHKMSCSPYACHSIKCPASHFFRKAPTLCDINNWQLAFFQAFAAVSMRPLLFRDVTQFRLILTEVSGKPIWSTFKKNSLFDGEDGTDRLSRNFGNYQSSLRNIPEERRSHLTAVK